MLPTVHFKLGNGEVKQPPPGAAAAAAAAALKLLSIGGWEIIVHMDFESEKTHRQPSQIHWTIDWMAGLQRAVTYLLKSLTVRAILRSECGRGCRRISTSELQITTPAGTGWVNPTSHFTGRDKTWLRTTC